MDWIFDTGRIYCLSKEGKIMAETTCVSKGKGEVDINRTYVDPILRGQGVAGEMMGQVVDYLREHKLKTTASCAYANAWLRKHAHSYGDVISDDMGDDFGACQIDGGK